MRLAAIVGAWALIGAAAPPAGADDGTLKVTDVTVSSAMPTFMGQRFEGRHLVDGDPRTAWRPGGRAPHFAWARLDLGQPAQVDGLIIHNGYQREGDADEHFRTTGRVRSAWVLFDDGSAEVIRLDPSRKGPRRVILSRLYTTRTVTVVIRDFELGERWNHLSVSELAVTGRPEPRASIEAPRASGEAECGTPEWIPLRDAVVRHCGDPAHGQACSDQVLDVVTRCRADDGDELAPLRWDRKDGEGGVSWSYAGRWFDLTIDLLPRAGERWYVSDLNLTDLTHRGD